MNEYYKVIHALPQKVYKLHEALSWSSPTLIQNYHNHQVHEIYGNYFNKHTYRSFDCWGEKNHELNVNHVYERRTCAYSVYNYVRYSPQLINLNVFRTVKRSLNSLRTFKCIIIDSFSFNCPITNDVLTSLSST